MRRHQPRPQRPNPALRKLVDTLRFPDDPKAAAAAVHEFHQSYKEETVTASQAKAHFEKAGHHIHRPIVETLVHYGVAREAGSGLGRTRRSSWTQRLEVDAPWTVCCGVLRPAKEVAAESKKYAELLAAQTPASP